jgi:hypothetical protein
LDFVPVSGNTLSIFEDGGNIQISATKAVGGFNSLILSDRTELGSAYYSFNPTKPSGTYTLATLDDITGGGFQNLQSVLSNGNSAEDNIVLTSEDKFIDISPDEGTITVTGGTDQPWSRFGTSTDEHYTTNTNLISVNYDRTEEGQITFNYPNKVSGNYIIATLDDITGGSQDLQQTLDNGSVATLLDDNIGLVEFNIDVRGVESETNQHAGIYSAKNQVFITSETADLDVSTVSITDGKTSITEVVNSTLSTTLLDFETPSGNNSLKIPAKTGTLATTQDITLQKAVENGGTSDENIELIDGAALVFKDSEGNTVGSIAGTTESLAIVMKQGDWNSQIQGNTASTNHTSFNLPIGNGTEKTLATTEDINLQKALDGGTTAIGKSILLKQTEGSAGLSYMDHQFFQILSETGASLEIGGVDDEVQLQYTKSGVDESNVLKFSGRTSNGIATFGFPDIIAGNHILSTTKIYTDSTTSAKSSATLTIDYPLALTGDKVQALSITGGAKIYEKTSTGWAEYAITVVP